MKPVRVGVVGVGHMGQLHAEKVATLQAADAGAHLAGVADLDPERAREVAGQHGVACHPSVEALLPHCDALVVAVPTSEHHRVVRAALAADRDVLVEKPIAATLAEAEELVALVGRRGLVLHVGHLEWFNGAMRAMRGLLEEPRFVEVHRIGPFSARATDVDVVRDLMIHDLHILQQLLGEEPLRIEAVGVPVVTDHIDIANARLAFPSGCVANLTASRVSTVSKRRMRFFQRNGYLAVDFLSHSVRVHRRPSGSEGAGIVVEEKGFDREDALLEQLRAFVTAVRKREASPLPGQRALAALRTATGVIEAMPDWGEL